jgi:DNA-binding response OmpR family regulator
VSPRILVAEDDLAILETLRDGLVHEAFEVEEATAGDEALVAARSGRHDVLVLDWMLPGMSGIDVCRTLRAESDIPIIMLTARRSEVDKVLGLELGADDYVTKPFSMAELTGRIRALLRRRELDRAATTPAEREVGGIRLDFTRHQVAVDGRSVVLTPSEFRLLTMLAEEPERAFTRAQIMEQLWETPYVGNARAADGHVASLRRKIERDPAHPERIRTVRSIGYKLVAL